jgi:hypothetical protein
MPSMRPIALMLSTAAGLAACSGGGSGSTAPTAVADDARPACTAAATVSLAPGETRALTAAEAACFRLSAGDGAEYALAGYDARALEASRAGQAASALADPQYTVADATRGGSQSVSARPAAPAGSARAADVVFTQAANAAVDPADPHSRQTAWRQGERFMVKPLEGSAPVQARVVSIVGGKFALAVVESDEAGAGKVLDQAEEALQFLAQRGVPLLQSTFSGSIPTTAGSGQLLVLATAWDPARGAGAAWHRQDASGVSSFVWLNLNLRPGKGEGYEMYDHASFRVKVLAHELTHAWQAAWLHGTDGQSIAAAPGWSVEGGADFVAMDLVRRFLSVGFGSNWKWTEHLQPSHASVIFALEPADAKGRLSWGYYDASSLLRDLQGRLIGAGMSPEAAMAEVSRGAVAGWYGADGDGGAQAGLVERMRARLGASWDAASAVLLWTASQAADDRTANALLANPTYYGVGSEDARYGWKPAAEVRAGAGERAAVTQVAGGSFYVRVRGARSESTLSAVSSTPDARWMIARVR